MSAFPAPWLLPCGDTALVAEWGMTISPEVNAAVLALDAGLSARALPGVVETVPTYRSLLVHYDPLVLDAATLGEALLELAASPAAAPARGRRWRVPVVYGGAFGADLAAVAARHGMGEHEVVARHCGAVYRVYMLGFLPGFAYLGGLDPAIATPRLPEPRLETPAGTISIGGVQAGIACLPCPSGWSLLGRTPVRVYAPGRDPVFLLEAGDEVVFAAVPAAEWAGLEARAEAGDPVAELIGDAA